MKMMMNKMSLLTILVAVAACNKSGDSGGATPPPGYVTPPPVCSPANNCYTNGSVGASAYANISGISGSRRETTKYMIRDNPGQLEIYTGYGNYQNQYPYGQYPAYGGGGGYPQPIPTQPNATPWSCSTGSSLYATCERECNNFASGMEILVSYTNSNTANVSIRFPYQRPGGLCSSWGETYYVINFTSPMYTAANGGFAFQHTSSRNYTILIETTGAYRPTDQSVPVRVKYRGTVIGETTLNRGY